MSTETSGYIFGAIIIFGLLVALYFLTKDRVGILRSIKPNSLADFFDYHHELGILSYIVCMFIPLGVNPLFRILINLFALVIWVPFWILDRLFQLKIFEENNRK
jgi:hypothetical protein